jgi:hypothetical protein
MSILRLLRGRRKIEAEQHELERELREISRELFEVSNEDKYNVLSAYLSSAAGRGLPGGTSRTASSITKLPSQDLAVTSTKLPCASSVCRPRMTHPLEFSVRP